MNIRVGQGVDIHPFESGRKLILGGVEIPHTHGLKGHSDADALLHAICDAMLGALSLGDLGKHFSDKDPKNKGKESSFFLERVNEMVIQKGWKISNIDSTIITEEPMISPHIETMQSRIATLLKIKNNQISIKATRPEKLGSLGRKEGLTTLAIVLLYSG